MNKTIKKLTFYIIILLLIVNCTEPFETTDKTYENSLVVNALITNEVKKHKIKLSRVAKINSKDIIHEENAEVYIIDDTNYIYEFKEIDKGIYEAKNAFCAKANKLYTLNIKTQDGNSYNSTSEKLPSISEAYNISVKTTKNDILNEQNYTINNQYVLITINNLNNNSNDRFYRYEYEESGVITPRYWSNKVFKVISDTPPFNVEVIDKDINDEYCYIVNKSDKIILTETKSLTKNNILEHPIRTINTNDHIVSIRYGIFIKQYILNERTYNYYRLLNLFSDTDNVFSQTQVGEIPTNIKSNKNINEKIIGYFEISSISKKKFFFNRDDIIEYPYMKYSSCKDTITSLYDPNDKNFSPLINAINYNTHKYLAIGLGDYIVTPTRCSECTQYGSIKKPDFWIE